MRRLVTALAVCLSLLASHVARAQCPPTPANVSLEVGVCSFRLTWTIPTPGQVSNVVIRRSVNSFLFSASTAIATVSPLVPFHVDTPAQSTSDYTYWVVFIPADAQCPAVVSDPVSGRTFQSEEPAPQIVSATSTCSSVVTITARTIFDAVAYRLVRRAPGETSFSQIGPTQPGTVFVDSTPVAAGRLEYGVLPVGECGAASRAIFRSVQVNGPPTVAATPSQAVDYGGTATLGFTLGIGDSGGTRTLFRNGVAIDGPSQAPLTSYTHLIVNAEYADAGSYFLRVTTPCGSVDSPVVVVAVREKPCPVDFNDNNRRDIDDIFIFLNRWFADCP